jgi:hypothetical protein
MNHGMSDTHKTNYMILIKIRFFKKTRSPSLSPNVRPHSITFPTKHLQQFPVSCLTPAMRICSQPKMTNAEFLKCDLYLEAQNDI